MVLMNHFKRENKILCAKETAFNPIAMGIGFKSNLKMKPLLDSVGLELKRIKKVNIFNLWTTVSMVNKK